MADLQTVYLQAGGVDGPFQLLGLDLLGVRQEDRFAALKYAQRYAITYALASDDRGLLYGRLSHGARVPTTVFLSPDGRLLAVQTVSQSPSQLRESIQEFLGIRILP